MNDTRINTRTQFTATFTGRGEFYSGIGNGERVLLTVETTVYWIDGAFERTESGSIIDRRQRTSSHLSVQRLDGKSAHLGIRLDEVEDIQPLA